MPKIQGRELTEADIGSNVTYLPDHAKDDPKHGNMADSLVLKNVVEMGGFGLGLRAQMVRSVNDSYRS